MTIRKQITGTFDAAAARELASREIAWSGTVDPEARREQEAGLRTLADEISEALSDPDVVAVRVDRGEITEYVSA